MGTGNLGLSINITADSSNAEAALDAFQNKMVPSVVSGAEEMNRGLLSSHQSVHLLAEEMGMRLPRAVVGAVSEMLPSVGELGGALLGVFAVEKVYEFAEAGADKIRELFSEADESVKALDAAASAAFKHASDQAKSLFTEFKTSLAGTFNIAEIDARAAQLERYHEAFKQLNDKAGGDLRVLGTISVESVRLIADAAKEGITSAEAVDKKVTEIGQLQFEARQRFREVENKEDKASCDLAIHDLHEREEAARKADEAWQAATTQEYDYWARRREQAKEAAKEAARIQDEENRLEEHHVELMRDEEIWRSKANSEEAKEYADMAKGIDLRELSNRLIRQEKEESERLAKVWANAHPLAANMTEELKRMGISAKGLTVTEMELTGATKQFSVAATEQVMAVQKGIISSSEQLAAGLAGLIGGRRAQAAVEAAWETAQGVECLASGTWPPNPAAIIAAGLHFEAAAQFAIIAGSSSHRRSISAGSGSASSYDSRPRDPRGDGSGFSTPPQTLAESSASGRFGSAGSGVVIIRGTQEFENYVAAAVNGAVSRGVNVTATSSQRGAPVGH